MTFWKLLAVVFMGIAMVLCGIAFTGQGYQMTDSYLLLVSAVGCAICALLSVIVDRLPSKK